MEAEGLSFTTKLPFLRQKSQVEFQLEGEPSRRSGVIESFRLSVDPRDRVPRLSIRLSVPDSEQDDLLRDPVEDRSEFRARSVEVYEARGTSLEDVLAEVARARAKAQEASDQGAQPYLGVGASPAPPTLEEPNRGAGASDEEATEEAIEDWSDLVTDTAVLSSVEEALKPKSPSLDEAAEAAEATTGEGEGNADAVTAIAPVILESSAAIAPTEPDPLGPGIESRTVTTSLEIEEREFAFGLDSNDDDGTARRSPRFDVHGTGLDDEALSRLGSLSNLQYLSLRGTRVTEAGLDSLRQLRHLRHLDLTNTGIGDDGLRRICELARADDQDAEVLALPAPVTDDGDDQGKLNSADSFANMSLAPLGLAFTIGVLLTLGGVGLWSVVSEDESVAPDGVAPTVAAAIAPSHPGNADGPEPPEGNGAQDAGEQAVAVSSPSSSVPEEVATEPDAEVLANGIVEPDSLSREVPQADLVRVVTEGIGQVLIIPVAGELSPVNEYRLVRPFGVAIDLPRAEPRVAIGDYLPNEGGFVRVRINRGVASDEGGTHVRVHFAQREERYRIEVADGYLRVILPH